MSHNEFSLQEEQGKVRLLFNGHYVGVAVQDRNGYWDAEIANRVIGRFATMAEAKEALWKMRELALQNEWRNYPYFER